MVLLVHPVVVIVGMTNIESSFRAQHYSTKKGLNYLVIFFHLKVLTVDAGTGAKVPKNVTFFVGNANVLLSNKWFYHSNKLIILVSFAVMSACDADSIISSKFTN